MIKKIIISIAVVIVLLLVASSIVRDGDKGDFSLRFSWIPSASFAGDVVGIKKFSEDNDLSLSFGFGGPGINPIQMVISGQDTFGWAGADEVIAANEKGANLVIIGVIHYHPGAGYVSLKENNIITPKDLEGRSVGVLPFGNTTMIYESMLKANNVDRSTISEITISSDMKPFLSGAYDVHPVFIYDETVDLDKQNIEYNVIRPEEYGVENIKGYVYFTKRSFLEKNPDVVKRFVRTMADGWNYAINNHEESIDLLKSVAPEINKEREMEVLQRAIPYFTRYEGQPLNSDLESWELMVDELIERGVIENQVDLDRVLHLEFIHEYYRE